MIIGIIVDFIVTFIICLIMYKCLRAGQRPNKKTIFKAVGLGLLAIILSIILQLLFEWLINQTFEILFGRVMDQMPVFKVIDFVIRKVLIFVIIEEVAKCLLFKFMWNNGNFILKTPLQTTLLFVLVGATFSFVEDVFYIVNGTKPYFRIITSVSGHIVYALIYSLFFIKEVVRLRAMFKVNHFIKLLDNPSEYSNIYVFDRKYLLKGLLLCIFVHFAHNLICQLPLNNILSIILLITEVICLNIFFIFKIKKMIKNDTTYDDLARSRIITNYPNLVDDLNKLHEPK